MEKPRPEGPSLADIWRVPRAVWRARRLLDAGEVGAAQAVVAPLLGRFGSVTLVRKVAAEVLYASGDPVSAASLLEQVAKKLPSDRAVAVGLVASYAALNRAGDARRSAAMLPRHVDVRLALAWSELVATGGDPARGRVLVDEIVRDPELRRSPERLAMHLALRAIAAAREGDAEIIRARLSEAQRLSAKLRSADRAFLGYLGGVALRDAGLRDEARNAFTTAIDASPASIGAALARRERANMELR